MIKNREIGTLSLQKRASVQDWSLPHNALPIRGLKRETPSPDGNIMTDFFTVLQIL
jgi:hypothetical protein